MFPEVGDVWMAPWSLEYLVTEIRDGYAWAILLGEVDTKVEIFHAMDGPIPKTWVRLVAGGEA